MYNKDWFKEGYIFKTLKEIDKLTEFLKNNNIDEHSTYLVPIVSEVCGGYTVKIIRLSKHEVDGFAKINSIRIIDAQRHIYRKALKNE